MAVETNKDFDLKFTRNPISNDVVLKIDRPASNLYPSIEQSLRNILMTGLHFHFCATVFLQNY